MRALGRIVVLLSALLGALAGSQFPEFAQQYRQRLGGALAELDAIVDQFDADAARNQLTRQAALDTDGAAEEAFLRDRGESMAGTLARYERLFQQRVRLEAAPILMRPVVVLNQPDARVLRGAWADFEPAAPMTTAGLAWGALGFLIVGGLVSLIRQVAGLRRPSGRRTRPDAQTANSPH